MTKAIVAKVEKFLEAAEAKLDPQIPRLYWLPPLPGAARDAALAQIGENARAGDIIMTWVPPEARAPLEYDPIAHARPDRISRPALGGLENLE
jgi:hypothetical protein